MEPKETKRLGKVTIYYNDPKTEKSPRYKVKVTLEDGRVIETPLWFNNKPGEPDFNINGYIEEVLNPAPPKERPVSQDEEKEGWKRVKAELEPPKDEDDVPF